MSLPTIAEEYAKLIEHLRKGQENAAMIAHLLNSEGGGKGAVLSRAWLHIEDNLKKMCDIVTKLAQGRLN